jgi:MFS superfamily sulfate permease-like transporter
VGAAVLIVSVTGLLRLCARYVPVPVVKGIQLGAGLSLIIGAGSTLLTRLGWFYPVLDNKIWASLAFLALLATQKLPRFPYALYVTIIALVFASILTATSHEYNRFPQFNIWHPSVRVPSYFPEALQMAVGQLPLTLLNSVIAVSALSADLLPERPTPSVTAMGISVGLMNLTGTFLGAMPVCHGAGGLAAQYRFGARSGASVIMLGLFKLFIGLFLGRSLRDLLRNFPKSLLGVMVVAAGLELAKAGSSINNGAADLWESAAESDGPDLLAAFRRHREPSEEEKMERWTIMLITAAGILAFHNDAVGFIAGMLCYWSYRLPEWMSRWNGRHRGISL